MDDASHRDSLLWRLFLFDGPILANNSGDITRRFRSQRIGALLGYLGLHLGRPVPREELYEALWPEEDIEVTGNRLRVCLSSLRRQLEPDGVEFGAVIDVSEHGRIRLRSETVWCDTAVFDALAASGDTATAARLAQRKSLLPGYYDEWVLDARNRYELLIEDVEVPAVAATPVHTEAAPAVASSVEALPPNPISGRLPLYLTRFFGRDEEINSVQSLLHTHRLVTVAGPGGIGKTRMACEAARKLGGEVLFVALADVLDSDQANAAVLRALDVSAQPGVNLAEQLASVLPHRKISLLILDNAEQAAESVAELCIRLLEADADLRVLVTSRHHLEIQGEAIVTLSPLENRPHTASSEQLVEWPSIALFLNRARTIRLDFSLNARSAEAVVEICQRLDGIPLAIELAAARIASETPVQIAAAVNTNLIDLKARHRGLSERHRSLRAAIQGSFELLTPELRRAFAALSVFHGGWTEEAAAAVTGIDQAPGYLIELVTRSLIVAVSNAADTSAMRFSFLEPLRQFAAEALTEDERKVYTNRHDTYYLSLAASISIEDVRTYVRLDGEQENILDALNRRSGYRDIDFWRGLFGYVSHSWSRADHRITLKWVDEATAMLPAIDDAEVRGGIMNMVSHIWPDIGRFEDALELAEMEVSYGSKYGEPSLPVTAMVTKSYVLNRMARYREAKDTSLEALKRARTIGHPTLLLWSLSMAAATLSDLGMEQGSATHEGRETLLLSKQYCNELANTMPAYSRYRSTTYYMLSGILDSLGDYDEAYEMVKLAQRLSLEDKKLSTFMLTLVMEAFVAERVELAEYAATLMGAAYGLQERMLFNYGEQAEAIAGLVERLRRRLGDDLYEYWLRQGKQCSFDELTSRRLTQEQVASLNRDSVTL